MKFSRTTIIELVNALPFSTHAAMDEVALRFGFEDSLRFGGLNGKKTALMSHLIKNEELTGPKGGNLVIELIEYLLERNRDIYPLDHFSQLLNALQQDGYVVDGLKVRAALPANLPIAPEEDEMTGLLKTYGFTVAQGHFDQAIAAHTRGDWAACNGQLRSFVEDLFDQIAHKLSSGKTLSLPSTHARREWLAKCSPPFLEPSLNEWDLGGNGGFVQGFWKRLHPSGSHPGLSDQEDAAFRLHIVIIVAAYYLRRFHHRIAQVVP